MNDNSQIPINESNSEVVEKNKKKSFFAYRKLLIFFAIALSVYVVFFEVVPFLLGTFSNKKPPTVTTNLVPPEKLGAKRKPNQLGETDEVIKNKIAREAEALASANIETIGSASQPDASVLSTGQIESENEEKNPPNNSTVFQNAQQTNENTSAEPPTRGRKAHLKVDKEFHDRYLAKYESLTTTSSLKSGYGLRSVYFPTPDEVDPIESTAQNTSNNSDESGIQKQPTDIPYLEVIPGKMIIGYNSDYISTIAAEVLTGKFAGAKLSGSAQVSKHVEKAVFQFNSMFWEGTTYSINALAVDSKTAIPAVEGKVKKHYFHNLVYGFSGAFLEAFAQKRAIDSSPILSSIDLPVVGGVGNFVQDTDALIESRALSAAARTLNGIGEFRDPTYSKNAFESIGIIFLPDGNAIEQ